MFSILHRDNLASHPNNKRAVGGSVALILYRSNTNKSVR